VSGLDLFSVTEEIGAFVENAFPWKVVYGGIEDAETLIAENGVDEPFIVLQFTDMQSRGRGDSFGGPRYGEYFSIVRAMVMSPLEKDVRKITSELNEKLLGFQPQNSSALSKQFGGGGFITPGSGSRPSVFSNIIAFQFAVNVDGVGQ
jgi:hypothetical protein